MSWHGERRGAAPGAPPGLALTFTERYRMEPPRPWWRRMLDLSRIVDVLQAVLALVLLIAVLYLGWLAATWSGRLVAPAVAGSGAAPSGAESIRLRTSDGVALRGWYAPAEADSEAAIVVVHDWGGSAAAVFREAAFLRQRYAMLAVELRGHRSHEAASTLGAAERRDVAAAVAELRERGARRIGVLGVGMGAVAAIGAAGEGNRISAVLADSPYLSAADLIAAEVDEDGLPASRPGNWAVLLGMLFRTGADVTAGDASAVLPGTKVPTLVVAGARDALLPQDALDALVAAESPLTVWTVADAGRDDLRAVAGSAYRQRALRFFDEHLTRP